MFENVFHRHRETADAATAPASHIGPPPGHWVDPPPSADILAKLDSLEELMNLTARAVLYLGKRQNSMAQDTDALAALQAEWAALRDAAASAVASAQNAAQVDAENAQLRAENDANANGLAQMRAEMEQMRAQLAALGHPAA